MNFAKITPRRRLIAALGLSLSLTLVGCNRLEEEARATEESNIKRLAILYGVFTGQNRGRPPKSEADFKKYIESKGPEYLDNFGVTSVDELFVSERDGQPYVIYYGRPGPNVPTLGGPITMYEQVGVEGKRFAASELGTIQKIDEEEFLLAVPDAKK